MDYFRCWSVRNVLDLYMDGRLGPLWNAWIGRHVDACGPCRQALATLGPFTAPAGPVAVPDGLAASILARLEAERAADVLAPSSAPLWTALSLGPAQALALAFLALVFTDGARAAVPPQSMTPASSWEWEAPR